MPVRPSSEDWSEENREDQAEEQTVPAVEEPPAEWCCQDEEKAGWGDGEKVA